MIVQSQTVRWTHYYYGGQANSVIYGEGGNIYAGGFCNHTVTVTDFTIISITNTGNRRWAYHYNYNRSLIGSDGVYSIAYGLDSNIYAAGYSTNSDTNFDFTIISLTNSGTERWIYKYNGPGNSDDRAYSIACGSDGNIYLTELTFSND